MDTTFYAFLPGAKAVIVLVGDNFSKAVLGAHVAPSKHAIHVGQALREAIAMIQLHHPLELQTVLVSDGGS